LNHGVKNNNSLIIEILYNNLTKKYINFSLDFKVKSSHRTQFRKNQGEKMENQDRSHVLPAKPRPDPAHTRQSFWQIWVPLGIGILAIVTLAVFAALNSFGNAALGGQYASVSLTFLILLYLPPALILMVILIALIYGLVKLLSILPVYTRYTQDFFVKVSYYVRQGSDWIAQPILKIRSWQAAAQTLFKHLQFH
jgi:hypothetical protein